MPYHKSDPELYALIEVGLFVLNRCFMCDLSEDTLFLLREIRDRMNQVKGKCELLPF